VEEVKSPNRETSAGGSEGSVISQGPSTVAPVSGPPVRKDPNEEFFMMTFLSYKLTHSEFEKVLAVRNTCNNVSICRWMGNSYLRR